MADYYSILGLSKTATDIEIKTAFRRLAKIYHPDKNPNDPNAKHLFENILKAYNVLGNVHTKRRYDNSNFAGTTQNYTKQKPGGRKQKDYSFTEEDLQRREYYKKHYHAKKHTVNQGPPKPHYSDYKYILYATPIAVGLLMLIVSLFSADPVTEILPEKKSITIETKTPPIKLVNGNTPYRGYFGDIKTFDTQNYSKISNTSNYDAVIVMFNKKTNTYLQHAYLQASYSIEFSKLPETGVYWKCVLGKNWDPEKVVIKDKVVGGFDSIVQYQNWQLSPILFPNNTDEEKLLYVIPPNSKNKQYISNDKAFFER
jgi:hypothetical protein